MRNLFIGIVSAMLVVAIAPASARAEEEAINPFQLVALAESGSFASQDIPTYDSLSSAYRTGEVTGKDVVKAAIANGWLAESYLNDSSYISAVESQLHVLQSDD